MDFIAEDFRVAEPSANRILFGNFIWGSLIYQYFCSKARL
jgi:hypothetical protein